MKTINPSVGNADKSGGGMTSIIKVLAILILCIILLDVGLSLVFHAGFSPLGFGRNMGHGFGCGFGRFF